jgi:hypothetical protein
LLILSIASGGLYPTVPAGTPDILPPVDDTAAALTEALVAAYRPHAASRLAALGFPAPPDWDDALGAGEAWLAGALEDLLSRPFGRQPRGPLEVFQEAMRFPTEALAAAGAPAADRDPAAREALPGDRFDLAPASSQDLGEEVWGRHLAWGAAKARALSRPVVVLVSADLMDASRVESEAGAAGYRCEVWRSLPDEPGRPPGVALVDLTHRQADDAIRALSEAGARVIAFGPHVDDLAMVRARTLGASDALPRSRFFSSIGSLLPEVV